MKKVGFFIQKEFLQIFRNKAMRPLLIIMPFMQLIILGYSATFEIKTLTIGLDGRDMHPLSQQIRTALIHQSILNSFIFYPSEMSGGEILKYGDADIIVTIGRSNSGESTMPLEFQIVTNAVDGNAALVGSGYVLEMVKKEIDRYIYAQTAQEQNMGLKITSRYKYNPNLDYSPYMVPGILVLLVTMIGTFLTSMNIVREKEIGTIEQLYVTPVSKWVIIAGKVIPFWVIGLLEFSIGLLAAWLFFGITTQGSLTLIYALASIYLIGVMGLGLIISTISNTMSQALFSSWFLMIVFILMSGLFTPIESMPFWAQVITWFNPVAYLIEIIRAVMIKGALSIHIIPEIMGLILFALLSVIVSVKIFRKSI